MGKAVAPIRVVCAEAVSQCLRFF
ncbi:hypothetical protein FRIGORI9N_100016 [Frigoribacterium sp. 9N]|nr:hypothetical protein FRIGORI9N_100016 [Frigoribacterium sp. 9N]